MQLRTSSLQFGDFFYLYKVTDFLRANFALQRQRTSPGEDEGWIFELTFLIFFFGVSLKSLIKICPTLAYTFSVSPIFEIIEITEI